MTDDASSDSEILWVPAFPGSRALRLRSEFESLPAAGLEGGGDVSVYRSGLRLRAAAPASERLTLQVLARYASSHYDFDGAQDFFELGPESDDPFDPLHELRFSLQGALAIPTPCCVVAARERWSLLGEGFGSARWEEGSFEQGWTGGVGVALGYELPGRLELALGVALRSRLARSGMRVAPVVRARWRATPEITLQTRGRGAEIAYRWGPTLRSSASVEWIGRSWRLDDRRGASGRLVLHDDQLRAGIGLQWKLHRQLRLRFECGVVALRDVEVDERGDHRLSRRDADPSAYIRLSFELRG